MWFFSEKRLAVFIPKRKTTSDFTKFSLSYYNHLTTRLRLRRQTKDIMQFFLSFFSCDLKLSFFFKILFNGKKKSCCVPSFLHKYCTYFSCCQLQRNNFTAQLFFSYFTLRASPLEKKTVKNLSSSIKTTNARANKFPILRNFSFFSRLYAVCGGRRTLHQEIYQVKRTAKHTAK